jgi:O-antigen ligase
LSIAATGALLAIPVLDSLEPRSDRGKSRTYLEEIVSMGDQDDGTRNQRIYTWTAGWVMFKSNPVVGVGAGNFSYRIGDYESHPELERLNIFRRSFAGRSAHSTYFTLFAEYGVPGTVAFLGMLGVCAARAWKFSAPTTRNSHARGLATGVGAALIAFAASGAFVTALYYPQFWLLCSISIYLTLLEGDSQGDTSASHRERAVSASHPRARAISRRLSA